MKLPIPDDWNGEYFCTEIQWPKSPYWIAILLGLLEMPMRGYTWDERTGSILDVQEIGREIFNKNFPFVSCDGDTDDIVGDTGDTGNIVASIFADCGFTECDDMSCSVPYGALRWSENGVLQFLYCGVWYDVEGSPNSLGGNVPSDTVIPDPPPGDLASSTRCAKAWALARAVYAVVLKATDEADSADDPFAFYSDMQDAIPGVDLAFGDLVNMYFSTIVIELAGLQGETEDIGVLPWLASTYYELIVNDTNSGITKDEYEDCCKATENALSQWFPSDQLGFYVEQRRVYAHACKAIGAKDAEKITFYAQPVEGDSCEAAIIVVPPEYSGFVWWKNERVITLEYQGATFHASNLKAINAIGLNVWGASNANFQEVQWRELFGASTTVGEIEIHINRTYAAIEDYFPGENWSDTNPSAESNYQKPFFHGVTAPDTITYTQEHNSQQIIAKWNVPVDLSGGSLENRWKINPKDQIAVQQRLVCDFVIVYAGEQR